jgi:hypothetical protein
MFIASVPGLFFIINPIKIIPKCRNLAFDFSDSKNSSELEFTRFFNIKERSRSEHLTLAENVNDFPDENWLKRRI